MDLVRAVLSLDGTDRFFLSLYVHDTTPAIARSARFTRIKTGGNAVDSRNTRIPMFRIIRPQNSIMEREYSIISKYFNYSYNLMT